MREPVEPASIMSAYCTSGEEGLCGAVQKTVLLGSGSDSKELGRGAEGWGRDGSGISVSIMGEGVTGCEGGKGGDSASTSTSTGPFHPAQRFNICSTALGPRPTWCFKTAPDLFWFCRTQEPYNGDGESKTKRDLPPRKITYPQTSWPHATFKSIVAATSWRKHQLFWLNDFFRKAGGGRRTGDRGWALPTMEQSVRIGVKAVESKHVLILGTQSKSLNHSFISFSGYASN